MKTNNWKTIKHLTVICLMLTSFFSISSKANANSISEPVPISEPKIGLESRNNCFILLEPVREHEEDSKVLEIICGLTKLELETKFQITTSYIVAKFYDDTNYNGLIVNFGGPERCSSSVAYSVSTMPASVNNRASSGSSYSGCYNIRVFDLTNFGGDSYACQDNCPSCGTLNERVSSWKISN